jgi:hypothetical protein
MKKILIILAALAILAAAAYPLLARSSYKGQGYYGGQGRYMAGECPYAYNDGSGRLQGTSGRYATGLQGNAGNRRGAKARGRGYGNRRGRGGYGCPWSERW